MNYCKANDIHTVIIGDITNIRRNKNLGKVTNQKLHAPQVTKEYVKKCNRTNRGLYKVFYLKQSPKFLEISNALAEELAQEAAEDAAPENETEE